MADCYAQIVSQAYADYIVAYGGVLENVRKIYNTECVWPVNERYAVCHLPVDSMREAVNRFSYNSIPKLFGLMDTSSMDSSGITPLHRQPYLGLTGKDIIVGIIDTGIDYTNPLFRYSDGRSRILQIWDQGEVYTDTQIAQGENGRPGTIGDFSVNYGRNYSQDEINRALTAQNPYELVPTRDVLGHGTFMAGIAAGGRDEVNEFTGAAPDADLVVVKLKPAKEYLKQFYLIREDVPVYQENDIMMAIAFVLEIARLYNKPVSILLGLGSNTGSHNGDAYVSQYMDMVGTLSGVSISVAAGNESNRGCHYLGRLDMDENMREVELRVGEDENGFIAELWGFAPDIYSVGFVSPYGEQIQRIVPKFSQTQEFNFLLSPTRIFINHRAVDSTSGAQVILMRFEAPSAGIWRIRVYGTNLLYGRFHIWLPIEGFISPDTYFLQPQPDNTVTAPGDSAIAMSVAAYNHFNNSIYLYSGRGFTTGGRVVPDFAAPGVNVYGPGLNGRFTSRSGTSVAAAHGAGAAALLLEWGIYGGNAFQMSTVQIKQYLIRGARRQEDVIYPSRIWGYGILDVYHAFEIFVT